MRIKLCLTVRFDRIDRRLDPIMGYGQGCRQKNWYYLAWQGNLAFFR